MFVQHLLHTCPSSCALTLDRTDFHTCGSTLSIAQLCDFSSFNQGTATPDIVEFLTLCLDYLSRYSNISAMARNCHRFLAESAKRRTVAKLHPQRLRSGRVSSKPVAENTTDLRVTQRGKDQTGCIGTSGPHSSINMLPDIQQYDVGAAGTQTRTPFSLLADTEEAGMSSEPETITQDSGFYGELDWLDSISWPVLPPLSELETGLFDVPGL